MPKLDGNEAAKAFRNMNKDAVLIFCTNYHQPTPDSFRAQPYRYIMKDLCDRMLEKEMPDIIHEMMIHAEVPYLNVTADGKIRRIPINQILYVSVIKRGAIVHQYSNGDDKEISCREAVNELYMQLSGMGFEYAHNSYIVNMANIIHVNKNIITIKKPKVI